MIAGAFRHVQHVGIKRLTKLINELVTRERSARNNSRFPQSYQLIGKPRGAICSLQGRNNKYLLVESIDSRASG